MTLTVVLAVMNGFQLGFIESIVEIGSYHLQVRPGAATVVPPAVIESRVRAVRGVTAVVPFVERQALIQGPFQRPRAALVRAVPPDLLTRDKSQARMIEMRSGSFDLRDPGSIVVGSELAFSLGLRVGDVVTLSSYAPGDGGRPAPRRDSFRLTGIFRTGYLDYDNGLLFIPLDAADSLYGNGRELPRTWGVKIADRFADSSALAGVRAVLSGLGCTVESWQSYNRSFFGALFMEKVMMMVLVGLIFLVVGFNVYHSLRRSVHERMEEIGVLKAVGVPPGRIQATFILEGLFIGVVGAAAGLVAGLLLAVNIDAVFAGIDRAIGAAVTAYRVLAFPFSALGAGRGFSVFSPSVFYLTRIPSRVFPGEAFLVCAFAVTACAVAAWAASRAVSRFRPSEVLRYE